MKSNTQRDWDKWFLGMAEYVSTASKDPSTKVGAVIIDQHRRVVSVGYNGFPRKLKDLPKRLLNRDYKIKGTIHAEINATLFAGKRLSGCTLYTWPFMPCAPCASFMIQTDIKRIVSYESDNPRWIEDFKLAKQWLKEAKVQLTLLKRDTSSS